MDEVLSKDTQREIIDRQKQDSKEKLNSLPGADGVTVKVVGHSCHDRTDYGGPDATLDKERQSIHVFAEAHNLQRFFHLGFSVAHHFVEYKDARLLERYRCNCQENHVTHAEPSWIVQGH